MLVKQIKLMEKKLDKAYKSSTKRWRRIRRCGGILILCTKSAWS